MEENLPSWEGLPPLFDTHAHYYDRRFGAEYEKKVEALLRDEIFECGVSHIVNVGTNAANSQKASEMAKKFPGMLASVGLHPGDAQYLTRPIDEELSAIDALLKNEEARRKDRFVALGEIGLDYHPKIDAGFFPDKKLQQYAFEAQMEMAKRYGLPVIIHDREAHGDSFETVLRHPSVSGIFHSYSGSAEMARELVKRGYYISFSGVITFKNAGKIREVVKSVPIDRLLIETDAPYLAPHPLRGTCNHSLKMRYTALAVAEIKELPIEEVATLTSENAMRCYRLPL